MSDEGSVTHWLGGLRVGDDEAAHAIWQRYFDKLTRLARRKMGGLPSRESDEEDVALSAIHSLVRGAVAGRFAQLENRDDLWKLLVTITARKVSTQRKRHFAQKRGGGQIRGDSVFQGSAQQQLAMGIEQIVGDEPTPQFAAEVAETCRVLLDQLDDDVLRSIALLKLEGFQNREISSQLDIAHRSIERKLNRIRTQWSSEYPE